nr:MAG TPA_asm: hypothetical protein [Caudoviricetes sp.]
MSFTEELMSTHYDKPKGRFFWYAFGIYKPKEPSLWFVVYIMVIVRSA